MKFAKFVINDGRIESRSDCGTFDPAGFSQALEILTTLRRSTFGAKHLLPDAPAFAVGVGMDANGPILGVPGPFDLNLPFDPSGAPSRHLWDASVIRYRPTHFHLKQWAAEANIRCRYQLLHETAPRDDKGWIGLNIGFSTRTTRGKMPEQEDWPVFQAAAAKIWKARPSLICFLEKEEPEYRFLLTDPTLVAFTDCFAAAMLLNPEGPY